MTDESKVGARSLGETLRLVGSSEAFTKRVVIWTLPISIFIAVAFDGNRFGTSRFGWAMVGILAHIFATMVLLGLRLIFLPTGPYSPKPIMTVLIFAVGSISRSLAVGQLSVMFGLAEEEQFLYRAFAGALLGTLTLAVAALIAALIKEHAQIQSELAVEREALVSARDSAKDMVDEQRFEIFKIVKESIEPAVAEISENLAQATSKDSGNLKSSAEKISTLIEAKLRPLSASLHQHQEIEIPRVKAIVEKPSLISLPRYMTIRNKVSPLAIYLVLVVPNTTGAFIYLGYASLPIVLFAYAPLALILSIFVRLPFANRPIRSSYALLLTTLFLALGWTPAIYLLGLLDIDLINSLGLIPTSTLGTILVGLLLTYGFIVDSQRRSYESELRIANQELNLEINRTSQLIWHIRQRAAQTLHGSVQASLTAANMRIRGAEAIDEDLLEKVREDLVRATESLTHLDGPQIDLETSIQDLVELWRGVCEIEISIPETLLLAISVDQVTSHCVNEILRESVTNAIRHGKASEVNISMTDLNNGSIQIEITNNGATKLSSAAGVGSRILDEITMDWNRKVAGDKVQVTARVALS